MDSLTSLGVLAPIARRLSDQYPADYLLAWCEYVQRHQAVITRPGGYLYRTITAGDWPPEPPPAVEVGPRPAPQAPRPAPKVQAKGGPTNQPSPDVEDRRLSERRRSIEIEAYIRADPERHESLRQEARRLLARDLAQVPVKWHGGHVAARVNELVAERLGFREARS